MSHDAAESGIQMSGGTPWMPDDDDEKEIESKATSMVAGEPVVSHNHLTPSPKPYGVCPKCDEERDAH